MSYPPTIIGESPTRRRNRAKHSRKDLSCPFCGDDILSYPSHLGDCEDAPRDIVA